MPTEAAARLALALSPVSCGGIGGEGNSQKATIEEGVSGGRLGRWLGGTRRRLDVMAELGSGHGGLAREKRGAWHTWMSPFYRRKGGGRGEARARG